MGGAGVEFAGGSLSLAQVAVGLGLAALELNTQKHTITKYCDNTEVMDRLWVLEVKVLTSGVFLPSRR